MCETDLEDGLRSQSEAEAEWARQQAEIEPIPCSDCKREGREAVQMQYQGIEYHPQTVLKERLDENSPGGVDYYDETVNCPFAVWRCIHGHEYTDGY